MTGPYETILHVRLGRLFHRKAGTGAAEVEETVVEIDAAELSRVFAAPRWLRDLGLLSWFLIGVGGVLVGLVVLLGITSTIVDPVLAGAVIAAVASPAVGWLKRHKIPRAGGAAIVLLALLAFGVLIFMLVLGGIVEQSDQIKAFANQALDKIEGWFHGVDVDGTSGAKSDVQSAVPAIGQTLLQGLGNGIRGLTSLAFFLSFTLFSTFFLLKDGPTIRAWAERHLGVPAPVARTITGRTIQSMRRYFLGVTIVAAFNAVVVGVGALILDVPLAGSIAVVTFVLAYIPFIGAFVAGAFAVILALASQGTTTALIMLVIVILANGALQNIVQPIAFGATLDLNPLAVLIVTISAGAIFGMVGMVLAAPLTSAAVHISQDLARARAAQAIAEPEEPPETEPVPT
jgi:predicted PurR-regulated permease PerM